MIVADFRIKFYNLHMSQKRQMMGKLKDMNYCTNWQ